MRILFSFPIWKFWNQDRMYHKSNMSWQPYQKEGNRGQPKCWFQQSTSKCMELFFQNTAKYNWCWRNRYPHSYTLHTHTLFEQDKLLLKMELNHIAMGMEMNFLSSNSTISPTNYKTRHLKYQLRKNQSSTKMLAPSDDWLREIIE